MPRYIDANEVLEFPGSVGSGYEEEMRELIEKRMPEDICDSYVDELEGLCKDVVSSVMNIVKTSPTADVAETVHAHWKHIGTFSNGAVYECSKCGRVIRTPELRNFPYCHCGAKMWESESDG